MKHYVYRLDCAGEFYIGVRTSQTEPERDQYMGSGDWCARKRRSGTRPSKTILGKYKSRMEAEISEILNILAVLKEPGCQNRRLLNWFKYRDLIPRSLRPF